jgi:tRNA A37 threonylcarbamoyladenosine biosynthesis protein TsaE
VAAPLHIHDPFASEPPRPRFRWPTYGIEEIANMPQADADWIVRGFLARGNVTELTADVRAGKTTFTAEMVRAMREGRPFLGQPTRWTRVWWLTEERPTTFLQAMRRAHLETCDVTEVCCMFRLDVAQIAWTELIQAIASEDKRLGGGGALIVDTLSRFVAVGPDQENDPAIAARAMEPLLKAAKQGMAIEVHRHARKGGGDVATAGRGSSAWSADCDIMLLLRRAPRPEQDDQAELANSSRRRVLEAASRFTETPGQDEPSTILLSPDGYGLVAGDTYRQQRYDDLDEQILLYAAAHAGCNRNEIRQTASIRGKASLRDDRVAELVSTNRLAERPTTRTDSRGRTYTTAGLFLGPNA